MLKLSKNEERKKINNKKNSNLKQYNSMKMNISSKNKKNKFYKNKFNNKQKKFFISVILLICFSLSKQNSNLRKINTIEEIILTITGPGTKLILNSDFNYPPDEIEIMGNKSSFIPKDNLQLSYSFELESGDNNIKLYYNTAPTTLKNMFKDLSGITKIDLTNFDTSNVNDMSNLFYNCQDLEEINLSKLITSSVKNMEGMFCKCSKIKSLNLSNFNTSLVKTMRNMFRECGELINIDISKFDTSSVTDMTSMFLSCQKLELIDISNFKITNTSMNSMFKSCFALQTVKFPENNKIICSDFSLIFQDCKHLTSLDLSNFDTSACTNMAFAFDNCYQLKFINLSNFVTSSVENFANMFSYCSNLEYLDLSHFDTSSAKYMNGMFTACTSLFFLNIKSIKINSDTSIENMFLEIHNTTTICYKTINAEKISASYNTLNVDCSYNCFSEAYKIIVEKKQCINECNSDDTYVYEYNNKCLKDCPNGTAVENNKCKDITTDINTEQITDGDASEEIFDTDEYKQTSIITEKSKIIDDWSAENFFLGLYNVDNENLINKDEIIKNIREDIINHNLDNLISEVVKEKEDKIIIEDNAIYQITTSDNQNNNNYTNISSIHLGECEKILKKKYGIKDNETLIILKIDYKIPGLLIPIIGYEVYEPLNKSKLNLSYCEQSSINYNIPVSIDEDNLFKYDPNSEYYNDECNTYTTENGTDILLNDRKEEFSENNMSLCENICEYIGYNSETKKALCECGIRYKELLLSELDNNINLLANNLTKDNVTTNIGTMKCYELVFSKDGLLTNIGSYILLGIIIFHFISIIIFYKLGYHFVDNSIKEILKEKKKNISNKKIIRNKSTIKNTVYDFDFKKEESNKNINNIFKIPRKRERSKTQKNSGNPLKKIHKNTNIIINNNQDNSSINNLHKSLSKLPLKVKDQHERKTRKIHSSFKIQKKSSKKSVQFNIKNSIVSYNIFELNSMDYKQALESDKRKYLEYYLSLIKIKHPILFSFFPIKDFNITIIKICLFFFSFAIYYVFNTIFFDFTIIHKIYKDEGEYNLSYLFPLIFYSFIISYVISSFIKYIVLSERDLLELKNEKTLRQTHRKVSKIEKCIIIRNVLYFIFSIAFLIFFWYYLSSFSAVYQNSQVSLIKNTFISFCLSFIYPFLYNLIPGVFRIFSLTKKNKEFIYKTSKILQLL